MSDHDDTIKVREITKETHPEEHEQIAKLDARLREILNRWPDEPGLRRGIRTYELNRPFPAVDAALWEFFMVHRAAPAWTVKRFALTTGSVKYVFQYSKFGTRSVFQLRARMVHGDSTLLETEFTEYPDPPDLLVNIGQQLNDEGEFDLTNPSVELLLLIRHIGDTFRDWLNEEEEARQLMKEIPDLMDKALDKASPTPLQSTEPSEALDIALRADAHPGTGTHASWPEDDWAWEQINTCMRPRKEVFQEWQQRMSRTRRPLQYPERSFRHAVNPKRKGREKKER